MKAERELTALSQVNHGTKDWINCKEWSNVALNIDWNQSYFKRFDHNQASAIVITLMLKFDIYLDISDI